MQIDVFNFITVLVTGANSGLGLAAAIKYAAQGASTLVLGVRNREKGESAKAAIICLPSRRLHVVQLARGVTKLNYETTVDGNESSLQINALSPALLSLLLLPKLRAAAAGLADGGLCHMSFVNSERRAL
ncbi:hypothetical protein M426DRAFT_17012 [Hypoxylon sp. CI-4A]|nr:hypothetical protein M426DRAFT_17012 [Hypoxylon sp. CI-4A]